MIDIKNIMIGILILFYSSLYNIDKWFQ